MRIKTNTSITMLHFESLFKIRMIMISLSFALLLSLLFLSGCSNDSESENSGKQENNEGNLSMNLKSLSSDLIDNSMLYVFKENNDFVKRQWNLVRSGNKISTSMDVGKWGLVLLSCNTDISNDITPPYGANRIGSKMWETKLKDANFLSQTPAELRYAFIDDVNIVADGNESKNATLNRNVGKIQIILEEYSGFSNINPGVNNYAFVELIDVPTTLGWDGKYLPSRDNPTTSPKPIRENFNFVNKNSQMVADTVNFIVPAHRGNDAFDPIHADTTKYKLKLRVSMPLNNASYFGKTPIEIPITPKINRIVQVGLKFRGEPDAELDVKVTVKDWAGDVIQNETFD
ncbi:MAG: FimB/Mfa2 family fimbrial subunit [Dysgonomonas sp.]